MKYTNYPVHKNDMYNWYNEMRVRDGMSACVCIEIVATYIRTYSTRSETKSQYRIDI